MKVTHNNIMKVTHNNIIKVTHNNIMKVTHNEFPKVITCALSVQQECQNVERQWWLMSLHFPELLPPQSDWFLSPYGLFTSKHTFQVT